jgi:hypothetical protein
MISLEEMEIRQSQESSTASLMFDKPLLTKKGNSITLDQYSLTLKPYEKVQIYMSMKTLIPEKVGEYFEVMVRDGSSQFF